MLFEVDANSLKSSIGYALELVKATSCTKGITINTRQQGYHIIAACIQSKISCGTWMSVLLYVFRALSNPALPPWLHLGLALALSAATVAQLQYESITCMCWHASTAVADGLLLSH